MKNQFFKTPNKIYKLGLDHVAIAVYCFYMSLPEEFDPSITFTAKTLKMARNTVVRANNDLQTVNAIRLVKRGHFNPAETGKKRSGEATQYELVESKYWKELNNEY